MQVAAPVTACFSDASMPSTLCARSMPSFSENGSGRRAPNNAVTASTGPIVGSTPHWGVVGSALESAGPGSVGGFSVWAGAISGRVRSARPVPSQADIIAYMDRRCAAGNNSIGGGHFVLPQTVRYVSVAVVHTDVVSSAICTLWHVHQAEHVLS
jgi:hypothetical protein